MNGNEKYRDVFKKLLRTHPKSNLEDYARVVSDIEEMKSRKKDITKTSLAEHLKEDRSKVARLVDGLERTGYAVQKGRTKSGRSVIVLTVAGEKRAYWEWEERNQVIAKHCKLLLSALSAKKLAVIVGSGLIKALKKALREKDYNTARQRHEQALKKLEKVKLKGNLKLVVLKTKALRVELSASGEIAAQRIKEVGRPKKESQKSSAAGKKKKVPAAA